MKTWGPECESPVSTQKTGHDCTCLSLWHWGEDRQILRVLQPASLAQAGEFLTHGKALSQEIRWVKVEEDIWLALANAFGGYVCIGTLCVNLTCMHTWVRVNASWKQRKHAEEAHKLSPPFLDEFLPYQFCSLSGYGPVTAWVCIQEHLNDIRELWTWSCSWCGVEE